MNWNQNKRHHLHDGQKSTKWFAFRAETNSRTSLAHDWLFWKMVDCGSEVSFPFGPGLKASGRRRALKTSSSSVKYARRSGPQLSSPSSSISSLVGFRTSAGSVCRHCWIRILNGCARTRRASRLVAWRIDLIELFEKIRTSLHSSKTKVWEELTKECQGLRCRLYLDCTEQ